MTPVDIDWGAPFDDSPGATRADAAVRAAWKPVPAPHVPVRPVTPHAVPAGMEGRYIVELGYLLIARGRRLIEAGEQAIVTERHDAEERIARAAELLDKPTIGYYRQQRQETAA